jgi:hypothetical protein
VLDQPPLAGPRVRLPLRHPLGNDVPRRAKADHRRALRPYGLDHVRQLLLGFRRRPDEERLSSRLSLKRDDGGELK